MSAAASDLEHILARNQRRMDVERREFAKAATAIVQNRPRAGTFDTLAYVLAMRDITRLLDDWYGAFPGDRRARFWTLILDECRAARALAFQRAAQAVRKRLPRDLIAMIREAA